MSVADTDIRFYGAANMPEDDESTVGGAVDLAVKIVFTDLAANDTIDLVSDDAGDTDQIYIVYGFDAAGARQEEEFTVTGTSTVTGNKTFERVNKIERQSGSALAGTLTWTEHSGGETLATMESAADAGAGTEITTVRKPFYNAASDPDSAKTLYSKIFARNNNATKTLVDAFIAVMDAPVFSTPTATTVDVTSEKGQKVLSVASTTGFTVGMSVIIGTGTDRKEAGKIANVSGGANVTLTNNLKYEHTSGQADGMARSRITCDVGSSLGGTDTSANRLTAPSGYAYTFDCSNHPVANVQNHTAGASQPLWLELILDAAQAPMKDTFTLREDGNTA